MCVLVCGYWNLLIQPVIMAELLRFSFGTNNAGRAPSVPFGGASPRSILGLELSTPGPWPCLELATVYALNLDRILCMILGPFSFVVIVHSDA